MRRFEGPDELAGLLVVSVSGEGDVVHRHLQSQLLTRHGGDLIRLRHDVLQHTHTHTHTGQARAWEQASALLRGELQPPWRASPPRSSQR